MNINLGVGPQLNLQKFMETRMLLTASSGGGKSWGLRRLIEQTHGHVQQLIFDPEGEFASLREKLDLIIAAPHDGDALAHPKTAKLLTERLLETRASAVLDIYDLKKPDRGLFVKICLETLMLMRKEDYRPLLLVLDEAHLFCPETGKDVSEATGAVIDVATRGRKRGICLVAATQRIAKFNKDAAAELHNKLVGFIGLDTDRKRAGDEMGFTAKDQVLSLRALEAGTFYAYGPAFVGNPGEVSGLKIGDVKTSHPKLGEKQLRKPPAPTAAIKRLLPQLADLPKEAEAEAKSVADLRKENAALKGRVTHLERNMHPDTKIAPAQLKAEYQRGYDDGAHAVREMLGKQLSKTAAAMATNALKDMRSRINSAIKDAFDGQRGVTYGPSEKTPQSFMPDISRVMQRVTGDGVALHSAAHPVPKGPMKSPKSISRDSLETIEIEGEPSPVTKPQQEILNALAWLAAVGMERPTRETLSAVSQKRGGNYTNRLGELKRANLIDFPDTGKVCLTDAGSAIARDTGNDIGLWERWLDVLTEPQKQILLALHAAWPEPMSRDALSKASGKSGGNYTNRLGELKRIGAIEFPSTGMVAISKHVIPE